MPNILGFGAVGDGVTDCTAAFNLCYAAAISGPGGDRVISFGDTPGTFRFASQPVITAQVRIQGAPGGTPLVRDYSGADFLTFNGTGTVMTGFTIMAAAGTSGGAAIRVTATSAYVAGFMTFRDLTISGNGNGTWGTPIFLDGQGRTIDPVGVRSIVFENCTVFNGTIYAMWWYNAQACRFNGAVYQGAGSTSDVQFAGTPSNMTNKCRFDGSCDGTLQFYDAQCTTVTGSIGGFWSGGGAGGMHTIAGHISGAVSDQLGNSKFLCP